MLLGRGRGSWRQGQPRGPTCVVMSQPSSRLTSTEEPVSRSSTTSTEICKILWICQRKGTELLGCRRCLGWALWPFLLEAGEPKEAETGVMQGHGT